MNREKFNDKDYFLGTEVEKTKFHGLKTLFLINVHKPVNEILKIYRENNCEHIYIGANKSINKKNYNEAFYLLNILNNMNYLVSIDIHQDLDNDSSLNKIYPLENNCLIIRTDMNYLKNRNVYVKIDNSGFFENNDKVWVFPLNDENSEKNITRKEEYENDY